MEKERKEQSKQPSRKQLDVVSQPHDKGYKRIFSVKKNFLDFIKKYVAFEWMMDLTVDDVELMDKEYISDQFDTYESDLVYKIRYMEGEVYLFFLQEMQSKNDFTMPFRLLTYMTLIWTDYFKNTEKKIRGRKEFRLPPIIPLVLYNHKDQWTAKRQFKEMVEQYEKFGEYIVDFRYILIDVKRLSTEKIKNSNTLVDNVLFVEQMSSTKAWIQNMIEVSQRVRQLSTEDQNAWLTWFEKAFLYSDEERKREFLKYFQKGDGRMISSIEMILMEEREEAMEEGMRKGIEKGKKEGIEEGVEKSKKMTAFNMRKKGYSDYVIADILEVGENTLQEWFSEMNAIKQ